MTAESTIIDSPESLRMALNILMRARHEASNAHARLVEQTRSYERFPHPYSEFAQNQIAKQKETREAYRIALNAERRIYELTRVFGETNPAHPECGLCRRYSITGGPGHEPSSACRSGKRPHCTCDACF